MKKYFVYISIFMALSVRMFGTEAGSSILPEGLRDFEFIPNSKFSKSHRGAVEWVGSNWDKLFPEIRSEIDKQAIRHNINRVNLTNIADNKLYFLIEEDEPWNGIWAVALVGHIPEFGSNYCIYIQMLKSNVAISAVSGLAYNFGATPVEKVAGQGVRFMDFNMNITNNWEFSRQEIDLISGVWKSFDIEDQDTFNKCFGMNHTWTKNELNESTYLVINKNKSCLMYTPFAGSSNIPWSGIIHGVKSTEFDNQKLIVLAAEDVNIKNVTSKELMFITLTSESRIIVRYRESRFEFRRQLKVPAYDYRSNKYLQEMSIGVLQ